MSNNSILIALQHKADSKMLRLVGMKMNRRYGCQTKMEKSRNFLKLDVNAGNHNGKVQKCNNQTPTFVIEGSTHPLMTAGV